MPTLNEVSNVELDEDEKKLRDGIFNLETIRFGKIPEIMIKKKYGYSFSNGTTEYDLISDSGEKIEVKFSCVREKEADITEENVLSICLDNSEFRTDRKVNSSEYQSAVFDCNIQQVKPDLFNYLYYGLFFEDRVAVFKMSSDDMFEFYTAKHFSSVGKRLEKVDEKLQEVIERIQNSPDGKATENYIRKRLEEKIPELLTEICETLKKIKNSDSKTYSLAKRIIEEEQLLKHISKTVKYISDDSKTVSKRIRKCEQLVNSLDAILVLDSIPDSSTKQHLKSDGEGQFHIKNTNLEWHLNSQFFHEWITYKELFELLENDR